MPTIDPTIKALASAIGEAETGASSPQAYTIKGKSGEYGRYQFMPDTWKAYAKESGITTPLDQSTVEEQNKVVYNKIKQWKDQGYNPAQIASMWNAGPGRPDAYKTGFKGTNDKGVAYDVSTYVKRVSQNYEKNKAANTGGMVADVNHQQLQGQKTFLGDVSKTLSDAATGFVKGFDPLTQRGLTGLPSTILQSGGALGAGVGGLLDNVLSHTPVVGDVYKGVTGLIGKGVEAAANTKTGQEVIGGYQQFAQAHPEMAADLEGAFNIATAVPILKGLGAVKLAAKDALVNATKKSVTKGAEAEIRGALTLRPTKSVAAAEARKLAPLDEIVKNPNYLPEVVRGDGGKFMYDAKKGMQALNQALDVDEGTLQQMLSQAVKKNIGVDLNVVRNRVLQDVSKNYQLSGNYKNIKKAVNDYFDSVLESSPRGRTVIDLNELNGIKRDVRNAVFDMSGDVKGTASAEVKYLMGQSLMKQVEDIAKQAGVKGVPELNKAMGTKLEALKVLKAIDGKAIKTKGGLGRELATDAAGAAGELAGGAAGIPFASTFAGRSLANFVGKRVPQTQVSRLRRAGLNSTKSNLRKGLIQVGAGMGLQTPTRSKEGQ